MLSIAPIFGMIELVICSYFMQLESLFSDLVTVGFSGSRHLSGAGLSALTSLLSLVPSGCRVSVGCATGADLAVRSVLAGSHSLSIFSVSSGRFGSGRSAYARRSVAIVESIPAGGLLVVVPSSACPAGVVPSRSFRGSGSGSWGSAALALGTGRRVLVYLADGTTPPHWDSIMWDFVSGVSGGNWWVGIKNEELRIKNEELRVKNEQLTIDGCLFG
jgi:hypothetical protein